MNAQIKIEKGLPIPKGRTRSVYPFPNMEIGDSFFAPGKTAGQLSNLTSHWRRKGFKYTVRAVTENGVKGARVWRLA